ncbi:SNF1-related protein kinase regulatory subunit beta-2-like [Humulus lupulus]|uniref:SNF1-related protein kinase regulatory subunit beta-2-like n=1 Tax=Humulus lupulus TaxID=3486 RepID=UPI002B403BAB|nr:SNF1-related protein kinase regulatory subunit beta-2-like [Humulus lupulus]
MVMGNARGGKDGEGPSGSKSFEDTDDVGYVVESEADGVFSDSMAMAGSPSHNPSGFHPYNLFNHHPNPLEGHQMPEQHVQAQNRASLQHSMPNHVMSNENLTRVKLSWNCGAKQVAVMGSWDNWETREILQSLGNGFTVVKTLPPGEYQYLFIVDGYLRWAPDLPWICDDLGNAYNVLDLQVCESELPESLSEFRSPPSPPSSYDNQFLNEDDFSRPPPETPSQLQSTILNNKSSSSNDGQQPQHTQLNHLYIQNHFEGQFMALGSTRRFRQKYVTMVLYKPLRRTN